MGNFHGRPDEVPPGGELLYVQKPGCSVRPDFEHAKPPNFASIQDGDWYTFKSKVQGAAQNMWSEKTSTLSFLLLLPLVFIPLILRSFVDFQVDMPRFANFGMVFIIGGFFVGFRYWTVTQNKVQDNYVREACTDLATKSGLTVEYRTTYIDFLRPKGTSPFRAIVISQAGMGIGSPSITNVSVMVPEGSGPGTVLQVQTPQGQIAQVTVPDGVMAGQTFNAQIPPAQPIVVTASIVSPFV